MCRHPDTGGPSWNIMQTKWEKFCLKFGGSYFYIWFVFYVSLPNEIKLLLFNIFFLTFSTKKQNKEIKSNNLMLGWRLIIIWSFLFAYFIFSASIAGLTFRRSKNDKILPIFEEIGCNYAWIVISRILYILESFC